MMTQTAERVDVKQIWAWLSEVPDPEIPVISITDLGIVREVAWSEEDPELCIVTVTPTYSGCPATETIQSDIRDHLRTRGMAKLALRTRLSPAWTTDWLTDAGRERLQAYGIAPPSCSNEAGRLFPAADLVHVTQPISTAPLACPLCGSVKTERISQFGSTPCKSLYRCLNCLEPFDHFKTH